MTMPEVVAFFERYAASFGAPVRRGVDVRAVTHDGSTFRVETARQHWCASSVVIATGHAQQPRIPQVAANFAGAVTQLVPTAYRRPSQLAAGGVLVVGAAATGLQLADELNRAGRDVTIAVGHHTRLPRVYRGRDILWWLDRMGVLDETVEQVHDVEISREQPSLQLVGHPDRRTLDSASLRDRGVRVVGRLVGADGHRVRFADDLVATTAAADIKLAGLLRRIDTFAAVQGINAPAAPDFVPHGLGFAGARTTLNLRTAGIRTVLWATGFRRQYPWLHVPVLDELGEIRHRHGITAVPGLYVIGLHFLRRRNSSFIDGVGADAIALSEHIASTLSGGARHDQWIGAAS